jgi:hypothetical protein
MEPYDPLSSETVSEFLDKQHRDYLALTSSFAADNHVLGEPLFSIILLHALGPNCDSVFFQLSQRLTKTSDWTYKTVTEAILLEADRQQAAESRGGVALHTSAHQGGGQARGNGYGRRKGKRRDREMVKAANGKMFPKGEFWCEFHQIKTTHSTDSCYDARDKADEKGKEGRKSQGANVTVLEPRMDPWGIDDVFPDELPDDVANVMDASVLNTTVQPEHTSSFLPSSSSALVVDGKARLVLDSVATQTFVNNPLLLHDIRPSV